MFGADASECRNMMPQTSQIERYPKNLLLPARFLSELLRTHLNSMPVGMSRRHSSTKSNVYRIEIESATLQEMILGNRHS